MSENKFAALATASAKVNRLIVSNIAEYAKIQEAVEQFIASPSVESAEFLDEQFKRVSNGFEAVRNSITVLASTAITGEVDSVDVVFDENGARFL